MIDREKVIKGLELCRYYPDPGMPLKSEVSCDICPYWDDTYGCRMNDMFDDAIALLKAQEPRVMTREEVEVLPDGHVLIETDKSDSLRWLDALLFCKNTNFQFDFITLEGRARLLGTEYNREWRCWDKRPTDEQREDTPWN